MQRLLSIALTFAKVSTQRELSYRAEFAGNFVNAFGVDAFMAVVAVSVIFVHTDSLRGWSAGEMLAVVGIWYFVLGLMSMVMFPSLNQVVEDVHEGTFDYVLMKPVPSLFLASTRNFAAANSAFVLMGLSLALFGIFALEAGQLSWRIALFPVLLASGLAIFYALLIAMTTLVFWAVRLDNIEHLFNVFFRTGRYPVDIYPVWIKGFLTFIFPGGFHLDRAHRNADRPRSVLADGAGPDNRVAGRLRGDALLEAGTQAVFKRFELDPAPAPSTHRVEVGSNRFSRSVWMTNQDGA